MWLSEKNWVLFLYCVCVFWGGWVIFGCALGWLLALYSVITPGDVLGESIQCLGSNQGCLCARQINVLSPILSLEPHEIVFFLIATMTDHFTMGCYASSCLWCSLRSHNSAVVLTEMWEAGYHMLCCNIRESQTAELLAAQGHGWQHRCADWSPHSWLLSHEWPLTAFSWSNHSVMLSRSESLIF